MKLAICVQIDHFSEPLSLALLTGSFSERARKARAIGYSELEIVPIAPNLVNAQTLLHETEAASMEIVAVSSGALAVKRGLSLLHPDSEIRDEALSSLFSLIDLASLVRSPIVTIGSFRGYQASMGTKGRVTLTSILREASDLAEDKGIRLVIEPLNRYETDLIYTAKEALRLIDEIDHPALGLLLDTYHMNIEETDWEEPLEQATSAGKLWHVHLGDNNRLPPGQGMIDFRLVISTLRQVGYHGALSAELLTKPDADTAAVLTWEHIQPLLSDKET